MYPVRIRGAGGSGVPTAGAGVNGTGIAVHPGQNGGKLCGPGPGASSFIVQGIRVQLVSNRKYAGFVEALLQPAQTKSFSQAMLETLSVVAYKQPVTRNDIEAIRGVRCEYSVSQLLKLGLIQELGRKDAVGRPMLFGTTDAFLRQFGLHDLGELPSYETFSKDISDEMEDMALQAPSVPEKDPDQLELELPNPLL